MRIQANLAPLAAYGLNIDDLRTTIGTANVNTPKGSFDGPTPRLHDQRQRPAEDRPHEYADLVIAYRNGAPVRLGDVAESSTAPRTPSSPPG